MAPNINAILRTESRSSARGAPMGARSFFDPAAPVLHLQRVQMVDGDYSPDGTYWGAGSDETGHIWCAFNETARVFVRAKNRADAARQVVEEYPAATFADDVPEFDLDAFVEGYTVCALWSSTDDDGEPLDAAYSTQDIAPKCLESMRETCADFVAANAADLAEYCSRMGGRGWTAEEQAGHDFWLTRNGHGTGFWDRGLGELGQRLSKAAKVYSSVDLYAGDDGLIYGE